MLFKDYKRWYREARPRRRGTETWFSTSLPYMEVSFILNSSAQGVPIEFLKKQACSSDSKVSIGVIFDTKKLVLVWVIADTKSAVRLWTPRGRLRWIAGAPCAKWGTGTCPYMAMCGAVNQVSLPLRRVQASRYHPLTHGKVFGPI